jgi:hypothetical protein
METLPRTPTQAFLHSDVIGEEIADDLIFFRCPNWVASAALSNVFDGRLDLGPRARSLVWERVRKLQTLSPPACRSSSDHAVKRLGFGMISVGRCCFAASKSWRQRRRKGDLLDHR